MDLATRLLSHYGGLEGLGKAKASQFKAALGLGKRLLTASAEQRVTIPPPQDVANLMAEMAFLVQEHLRVLLLNTRNQVVATSEVYKGNVNTTVIRAGDVSHEPVRTNCPAIIIVQVTKHLVEAGKLLGIEVLDHVTIGRHGFNSLKERGLRFG